jgi:NADPH:quinone reductase-like Zn-dependent oxidoreductase
MRAMQVRESLQGLTLYAVQPPQPTPGSEDVLIRVYAAGVTAAEIGWYPTTHQKSGEARLNAIPGHEFSGIVAAIGSGVKDLSIDQDVYGMND